jgi:hypothetical protein
MIKIIFAAILIIFSVPLLMMTIALEPALAARKPNLSRLSYDELINGNY